MFNNLVQSNTKKYKLLLVDEPRLFCGTIMGQGVIFCTNLNCTIKHRSEDKWKVKAGDLYVEKQKGVTQSFGFINPKISTNNIDDAVVQRWLTMSQTLKSWTRMFRAATNAVEEDSEATFDNIIKEREDMILSQIRL